MELAEVNKNLAIKQDGRWLCGRKIVRSDKNWQDSSLYMRHVSETALRIQLLQYPVTRQICETGAHKRSSLYSVLSPCLSVSVCCPINPAWTNQSRIETSTFIFDERNKSKFDSGEN
jgi:hypothetical protein